MDKWLKDILPDKDPYHNRGRDQMRKKKGGGSGMPVYKMATNYVVHHPLAENCSFGVKQQSLTHP